MKSTAFKDVDYNHATNVLTVTYHGGKKHAYHKVSQRTWNEFQHAPSKGKFLHDVIKDSHRSEAL
jgi:hypothetical protein